MKNVLLLGDSIRKGYDNAVKEALEGKANVYFPEENCRFAGYVFRYISEYCGLVTDGKPDIIHWNAGLWDCLRIFEEDPIATKEIYAYYIDRICARLKRFYPDAIVIFATTTSVKSERMDKSFMRYNEDIVAYNATAVEIVKKYGYLIDDLYEMSLGLDDEARSDGVHFYTPSGTEAFKNQVVSCIAPYLD